MAKKTGFWAEFKAFITRGNVLDMAVGIIIGGAFTAIVTALTNQILMPVINSVLFLITGGRGLENIYTYLHKAFVLNEAGVATAEIDLANSIYIDWGAFLTAILNFILIALVLFLIVRTINKVRAKAEELKAKKEEEDATAEAANEPAPAPEPAPEPVPAAPTTEELLAEIRDLLKDKQE